MIKLDCQKSLISHEIVKGMSLIFKTYYIKINDQLKNIVDYYLNYEDDPLNYISNIMSLTLIRIIEIENTEITRDVYLRFKDLDKSIEIASHYITLNLKEMLDPKNLAR